MYPVLYEIKCYITCCLLYFACVYVHLDVFNAVGFYKHNIFYRLSLYIDYVAQLRGAHKPKPWMWPWGATCIFKLCGGLSDKDPELHDNNTIRPGTTSSTAKFHSGNTYTYQ